METRSTLLSILLMGFGVLLVGYVAFQSVQTAGSPHRDSLPLEPAPVANWFTERSLTLLDKVNGGEGGIDLALAREQSPFKRVVPPVADSPDEEAEPEESREDVPDPEPIETRMVELHYRGLYTTAQGQLKVYLVVDGQLRIFDPGASVVAGWVIAEARARALRLEQEGGGEVLITFNSKKMLEVPIE